MIDHMCPRLLLWPHHSLVMAELDIRSLVFGLLLDRTCERKKILSDRPYSQLSKVEIVNYTIDYRS